MTSDNTAASPSDESTSTDQIESEWQFDAPDLQAVEAWLLDYADSRRIEAAIEAAAEAPTGDATSSSDIQITVDSTKSLNDSYFDTEDWHCYRAGYALRWRRTETRAELTLKALASGKDAIRRRRELTQTLANNATGDAEEESLNQGAGPVREAVRALRGTQPLRRLFDIATRRQRFWMKINGADAGEIALDETSIPVDEQPEALARVEIEVDADHVTGITDFVEKLRQACELTPTAHSKFETALLAHQLTPPKPPDFGPRDIVATLSVGEVAFAVLRRQFRIFLAREPGCRLGIDSEELHKMRVATRRMRAALSLFAEVLPVRMRRIREELRWVAALLGEVRDYDVQIEQVQTWIAQSEPFEQAAFAVLLEALHTGRAVARRRMLHGLDTRRYQRLLTTFAALLQHGPLRRSAAARMPINAVVAELIAARYRKVRKCAKALTETSVSADYHRLRILCKRLRYAVEFMAELCPEPARDFIERVSALQDLLGLHQDAYVAIVRLRDFSLAPPRHSPPQTSFVMGQLAQRYTQQAHELRRNFPKTYRRITGKPWKRLRRALQELPADDQDVLDDSCP